MDLVTSRVQEITVDMCVEKSSFVPDAMHKVMGLLS